MGELRAVLEPLGPVRGEGAAEDVLQARAELRDGLLGDLRVRVTDGLDELVVAAVVEDLPTSEDLGEDEAEPVEIGAAVELLGAARLLRAQVGELALEHVGLRLLPVLQAGEGDPEVEDLHVAGGAQHDVVGRDVAMNDAERLAVLVAEAVRVVQRVRELGADVDREPLGEEAILPRRELERGAERHAGDVLHHEVVSIAVLLEVVGGRDVAMVEAGGELRLGDGHALEAVVLGEDVAHALQREEALEPGDAAAASEHDLRHSAFAERTEDLVGTRRGSEVEELRTRLHDRGQLDRRRLRLRDGRWGRCDCCTHRLAGLLRLRRFGREVRVDLGEGGIVLERERSVWVELPRHL
jgi:hypothetical protein